jgi:methyl-accepting chemotaxis protein
MAHDHTTLRALIHRLIPGVKRRLARSVREHETAFLQLGERLQDFSRRAGELAEYSQELLASAAGQTMDEIIQVFHQELAVIHNVCSTAAADSAIEELTDIVRVIGELESALLEFGRLVRRLQMLGISTRIESARLGSEGRGFSTLADDVDKLANRIVAHTSSILENARSLTELLRRAGTQTEVMRGEQSSCSAKVFLEIKDNLDDLQAVATAAQQLSASLSEAARENRESIGEAVASMQFHDIVRQQVEHVEEALDDMEALVSGRNSGQGNGGEAVPDGELAAWIADVAGLQRNQVSNGRERFVHAVESLKCNLTDIAANVRGMEQEITSLLGQDVASGARTLSRIEQGIGNMLGAMRDFAGRGEDIGRTMGKVAATVSEIGSFLGDIEEVGAEIELIALNASIKAAHTGEQGKAMGVLAASVQQLSREANAQTDGVAALLRDISQAAASMGAKADSFLDTRQVRRMVGRLQEVVANLKDIDRESGAGFSNLQAESGKLGRDVADLTAGIVFHRRAAEQFDAAESALADLEQEARVLSPLDKDLHRPERLERMLQRYTMEAERLVHESALEATARQGGAAAANSASEEEWDNVELF